MNSIDSYQSKATMNAQSIISKIATRNGQADNGSLIAALDEETVSAAWNAFGLHVSRQLRMGRGVAVNKFGTFSFSAPDVILDGVTNPVERDKQPRQPVFLVAKEFVNGFNLKTAIAIGRQLRPYKVQTSGKIQHAIVNWAEIALYASQNKDSAKMAVERVIKSLSDIVRNRDVVEVEIPCVGTFFVKSHCAAVQFMDSLMDSCKVKYGINICLQEITKRPLSERKSKGDMRLTQQYLQQLSKSQHPEENNLMIDEGARNYLTNSLGIELPDTRPKTAKNSQVQSKKGGLMSKTVSDYIQQQFQLELRPSTQQISRMGFQRSVNDKVFALERLKYYIRDHALNIEDSFLDLCQQAFGKTSERKIRMNFDDFKRAVLKIDLPLNEIQIITLFQTLDVNNDGFVDKFDWLKAIVDKKTHVNYIKDVVFKFQIHTDDLLQRMNLHRDHPPVNLQQLKFALMHLDESLNQHKALKVANEILDGKETISMNDLLALFNTVEEDDKMYDLSWFKDTLHKMRDHLVDPQKMKVLRSSFEYFDEHQEGNLDTANFKTVLMESQLGLNVQDINRLVRYLPKNRDSLINYYDFIQMIMDVNKQMDQKDTAKDLVDFAQKISKYLTQKKFTVIQFLQQVKSGYGSCNIESTAQYLEKNLFTQLSHDECLEYCREMDVDGNGVVSDEDMNTFIKRYSYFNVRKDQSQIEQIVESLKIKPQVGDNFSAIEKTYVQSKSIDLITMGQKKVFQSLVDGMNQQKSLFPVEELPESKFDQILKDLRIKLNRKGMGYEELFTFLDTDHNGFLSISEFYNIDKIMTLSQPAKDGFFAFMDKQRIGLIDLNTFVKFMSKSIIQQMPSLSEDDWDWELEILFKIRNWCQRENITIEDAFRTFDKDFDGQINKADLRTFLKDILKVEEKEITEAKINRLYKLMDQYKRGKITLMDFRRFVEEGFFYGKNKQVFGQTTNLAAKQQSESRSSFDWKMNARQQIGLIISRHYPSVKESFDIVSGYRKKLVFQKFKKWIDEKNVLSGFDLTEKLVYEIFSDLDSHKKGYLVESDWLNAFAQYNWQDQMIKEIQDALSTYFSSIQNAIHYFQMEHSHVITKESFAKALQTLFPKRFVEGDIETLWTRVQKNGSLSNHAFALIFGKGGKAYELPEGQQQLQHIRPMTQGGLSELPLDDRNQVNISLLDKIRRFLRNSNKNISELFKQYDSDNTGFITNLEFRQVIRSLNMGLTFQDIDILSAMLDTDRNSMVNWRDFAKRLDFRQADNKILERAGIHLQKVNDHIYHYLLSPKDAFRQIDAQHTGYLSFDKFKDMIEMLYRLATEDIPPFAIIKDLFEFIDKRRDGLLDLTEWMDAFSKFSNPNEKKRPMSANVRMKKSSQKSLMAQTDKGWMTKQGALSPQQFEGLTDDGLMNATNKFKTFLRRPPAKQTALQYVENGIWESSKEFDRTINAIGKNRKYLLEIFKHLTQNGQIPLTEDLIKLEMDKMLRSQGIVVRDEQWPQLISWSKKNGRIDYKFLLEVYKDRLNGMDTQPRMGDE
ncbi:unnamed protein product (macronuclear) [Paramecium tetraurelia]|uniref:EF-hand domain-containing protein n=1 Tax=Paramecium tetraurelia TaxID=5888 RepID=A0BUR2_PARTE|nr:uncharacterized protein GSPATT00005525001 [Paramecium tetraurelia]CAK62279.1 unnamed protein product [Paramecium tetraurelia]|eukprot:XP_001429677.1 hypothetical protein (macronuclear) [Paramecium tetraurelia strain d4-2]